MVESEAKRELKGAGNAGSEVVVMDDSILEAAARSAVPPVHNLATRSFSFHMGPEFVCVTQKTDKTKVAKGQSIDQELASPSNSRKLRWRIAVFVCLALILASALIFLIFIFVLVEQESRLDIDLPLPGPLWKVAKSTTKAERLSFGAAIIVLVICITLIVYFVVIGNKNSENFDVAPHEWFITRDMWSAPPFNTTERMDEFEPVRLVIISHTASSPCTRFDICAPTLRVLQSWHMRENGYDIPYSFLIGGEGRVYEARGWNVVGANTGGYDHCSVEIAFIGDYREGLPSFSQVSELQLERTHMLLAQGVELGHIHPQYQVVGARDLKPTTSPGANLYNTIQQWEQFAHDNVFRNRTCQEIRSLFEEESSTTAELEEIQV